MTSKEATNGNNTIEDTPKLSAHLLEPIQYPLAQKFYKECRYHSRVDKQDQVWVLRDRGTICGALRLARLDRYTLLRSMVIHPGKRRNKLGSRFLELIAPHLPEDVWCFPFEHLANFYSTINFNQVKPEMAPASIRHKYISYVTQGRQILLMHRVKSS